MFEGVLPQGDETSESGEEVVELVLKKASASVTLVRAGAVLRRRATDGRGDVRIVKPQFVVAAYRVGCGGEAEAMESVVEPVA